MVWYSRDAQTEVIVGVKRNKTFFVDDQDSRIRYGRCKPTSSDYVFAIVSAVSRIIRKHG